MNDTATLRIEARFKNARLYNAICAQKVPASSKSPNGAARQESGPIKPWCDFHGISASYVYELLNLKRGPFRYHPYSKRPAGVRDLCQKLAALLERDVQWLFPEELYKTKWPRLTTDVSSERFLSLGAAPKQVFELPPVQEDDLIQNELRRNIASVLHTISPRDAAVIRMRFGLDGADEHTLAETGKEFGVGVERIRQIEARALRKLRHPSRSKKLRPYIDLRSRISRVETAATIKTPEQSVVTETLPLEDAKPIQVYVSQDAIDALLREGEVLLQSMKPV